MNRKAIAYASDVILGRTGEVIGREAQKELIRQYAADNEIEVVAWFEDEAYNEDVLSRPGIQGLLGCDLDCDCILVERVWALSRQWPVLSGFLKTLESRGLRLESATTLWDCTSQRCRHRNHEAGRAVRPVRAPVAAVENQPAARVRRPRRLNFAFRKPLGDVA